VLFPARFHTGEDQCQIRLRPSAKCKREMRVGQKKTCERPLDLPFDGIVCFCHRVPLSVPPPVPAS
jgi:hypothetical protein